MVSLRPFREEEYPAWNDAHRAEYERGLVEFAGLSRDAARANRSLGYSERAVHMRKPL